MSVNTLYHASQPHDSPASVKGGGNRKGPVPHYFTHCGSNLLKVEDPGMSGGLGPGCPFLNAGEEGSNVSAHFERER